MIGVLVVVGLVYSLYSITSSKDRKSFLYSLGLPIFSRLPRTIKAIQVTPMERAKIRKIGLDESNRLRLEYYGAQKTGLMILIVYIGLIFLTGSKSLDSDYFITRNIINRPDFGESAISKTVSVVTSQKTQDGDPLEALVPLDIEPALPDPESRMSYLLEAASQMQALMVYEGETYDKVTKGLQFPEEPFNLPITASYEVLSHELIQQDGSLVYEKLEESKGQSARIQVTLSMGDSSLVENYDFMVYLPAFDAKALGRLAKDSIIEVENQIILPTHLGPNNLEVTWAIDEGGLSMLPILICIVGLLILVHRFYQEELNKKCTARETAILRDFPDVILNLTLLLQAGISFRSAFTRIAQTYGMNLDQLDQSRPFYAGLVLAIREMDNGVAISEALRNLAHNTNIREVRRMTHLIINAMSLGDDALCESLLNLSKEAWELKAYQIKKHGEEASTKMLLPLALSLVTIMIIVLAPAFISMNLGGM